jgi:hypothetical protein
MSDDLRLVPLDDDVDVPEIPDAALANLDQVAPEAAPAVALESRDWSDQGFEPNNYDERPPHWED